MRANDSAVLRERRARRRGSWHGYDNDDRSYRRRWLAIGCEITTMMSVPTLNWPADLFVDCHAPEAEIAI